MADRGGRGGPGPGPSSRGRSTGRGTAGRGRKDRRQDSSQSSGCARPTYDPHFPRHPRLAARLPSQYLLSSHRTGLTRAVCQVVTAAERRALPGTPQSRQNRLSRGCVRSASGADGTACTGADVGQFVGHPGGQSLVFGSFDPSANTTPEPRGRQAHDPRQQNGYAAQQNGYGRGPVAAVQGQMHPYGHQVSMRVLCSCDIAGVVRSCLLLRACDLTVVRSSS